MTIKADFVKGGILIAEAGSRRFLKLKVSPGVTRVFDSRSGRHLPMPREHYAISEHPSEITNSPDFEHFMADLESTLETLPTILSERACNTRRRRESRILGLAGLCDLVPDRAPDAIDLIARGGDLDIIDAVLRIAERSCENYPAQPLAALMRHYDRSRAPLQFELEQRCAPLRLIAAALRADRVDEFLRLANKVREDRRMILMASTILHFSDPVEMAKRAFEALPNDSDLAEGILFEYLQRDAFYITSPPPGPSADMLKILSNLKPQQLPMVIESLHQMTQTRSSRAPARDWVPGLVNALWSRVAQAAAPPPEMMMRAP